MPDLYQNSSEKLTATNNLLAIATATRQIKFVAQVYCLAVVEESLGAARIRLGAFVLVFHPKYTSN